MLVFAISGLECSSGILGDLVFAVEWDVECGAAGAVVVGDVDVLLTESEFGLNARDGVGVGVVDGFGDGGGEDAFGGEVVREDAAEDADRADDDEDLAGSR